MLAFLRGPGGAFYASQDADLVRGEHSGDYFALPDAERRRRGVPRVDTHLYARENGWAATGLAALYAATGDEVVLEQAVAAARFVLERRALPGAGFRHDDVDAAGPYLADTLAAGRAFLALYAATGERPWLDHACGAAAFMARFARDDVPGLATALADPIGPPRPQREENVQAARFANLLFRYTGEAAHRALAERAMRYLAAPAAATRPQTGGVLLADRELAQEPLHVTVVGPRSDPATAALLREALRAPEPYKRVELWDPAEGPLPNASVEYPRLARPAAFLCAAGRCSAPSYDAATLRDRLAKAQGALGPLASARPIGTLPGAVPGP
jgi:hypothetical protein